MLHYALKHKNPIKAITYLYRNFTEKAPRIKNFIIFEDDMTRIRQGNIKLETLFIFTVAQTFKYLHNGPSTQGSLCQRILCHLNRP